MQYIINKFSNLFVRKRTQPVVFADISPKPDQLHSYIVEKSKTGPAGTYIYSDPQQAVYYKFESKPVHDKFYTYISEKAESGPKGVYIYSDPKHQLYFKKLKQ